MRLAGNVRARRRVAGLAIGATVGVLGIAAAAGALSSATVPNTKAVTFKVPKTHVTGSATITLGTYDALSAKPATAVFAGNLGAVSSSGEEAVHCDLTIGSPARVIGFFDQEGSGVHLPSTSYVRETVAITGTFTPAAGENLALRCTTRAGTSDAILFSGNVVVTQVKSQTGGV
jgi:hypothetical protein